MDKQQGPTVEHREPYLISYDMAFPGGPVVKNLPCNAGDAGLIPGRGTNGAFLGGSVVKNLFANTGDVGSIPG